ncbi:MAG: hypothetical protein RR543_06420, partial [Erysipelotrichales bacterium]
LREEGNLIDHEVNNLVTINLFTTITNANFDDEVFYERVKETLKTKERLLSTLKNKENLSEAALWNASNKLEIDVKVGLLQKIKDAIFVKDQVSIDSVLDEKSTKVG